MTASPIEASRQPASPGRFSAKTVGCGSASGNRQARMPGGARIDLHDWATDNHDQMDIYEEIVKLRSLGRRGAVATIVNVRGSIPSFETAKMLVRDDGSILGTIGGGCVEAEVWQAAREVMESEKPRSLTFNLNQDPKYDTGLVCGGTLDIYVEPILPPAVLYIFGAGHVALHLSRSAGQVGFQVTIVDDRDSYATAERFPDARAVIAEDFEKTMAQIAPDESSSIVIVTRGHRDDMRILRWAVQTRARYVGMIGSKRKTITIFRELTKQGVPAHLFERVHAPVGLDIGAITPEEIAVAITAELIAVRRHCERTLPHMSWFLTQKPSADQEKPELEEEKT
jgi:xanthine dehydrogenase accessory factor